MMNFLHPLGQFRYDDLQIISTKTNEEKEQNIRLTIIITFEFAFLEHLTLLVQQALGIYDLKKCASCDQILQQQCASCI
jgi:hypothetical protein